MAKIQAMTVATGSAGLRRIGDLDFLSWPALAAAGVEVLVTTRGGGVSGGPYAALNLSLHVGDEPGHVLENRRRVAVALGASPGDFVFAHQVHGTGVAVVSRADRGRGTVTTDDAIPQADVLVTSDPGTILAIMVADCVPIVLYDPVAQVLGCVHAGWRGTVARAADAALDAMRSLGARPEHILAAVGPAIAAERYQVGDDVATEAYWGFGKELDGILRSDDSGRWRFDLPAANARILREAGVPDTQIYPAGLSTGADPGLFFSDRDARPCGRFAALARLAPRAGQ